MTGEAYGLGGFMEGLSGGFAAGRRLGKSINGDKSAAAPPPTDQLPDSSNPPLITPKDANHSISATPTGSASDPVASDIPLEGRAFLNGISGPESAGKYNIRYDGGAGSTFNNYTDHPRVLVPAKEGNSSAAGRYQIVATTWDGVPIEARGGKEFTPENQDRAAWYIAQRDYKANTGRDLLGDLKSEGFSSRISGGLNKTWASLQGKSGMEKAAGLYQNSINRYSSGSTPSSPTPVKDAGSTPATTPKSIQATQEAPKKLSALELADQIFPDGRSILGG